MDPTEIMKMPYARLVLPDGDGGYAAEIVEFPGCIAIGSTAAEALENLDSVGVDWIETALEQGQNIPEPIDAAGFSGKFVLRMAKSLHKKATLFAERDGVSLNQFIVTCVAERIGTRAHPFVQAQPYQAITNLNLQIVGAQIVTNWLNPQQQRSLPSSATPLFVPFNTGKEGQYAGS